MSLRADSSYVPPKLVFAGATKKVIANFHRNLMGQMEFKGWVDSSRAGKRGTVPCFRLPWFHFACIRFALLSLILLPLSGCLDVTGGRALPAPIRDAVEYEMTGRVHCVRGGDHFEFGELDELHFVMIRGIDCPKYGQKFFGQPYTTLLNMTRGKQVRVEVVGRDETMIEIADVFLINQDPADIEGDLNVGLELMRQGWGWYDGTVFEGSEQFKQAELDAKTNRIGLWVDPDPVPPWEFEAATRRKNGPSRFE